MKNATVRIGVCCVTAALGVGMTLSAALADVALRVEPIMPLQVPHENKHKVRLGERLFSDKRLSADNSISCESCHSLTEQGQDHLPVSVGVGGALGEIKSPTVFNSGYNMAQFWDGRVKSLAEQVSGPLHNPVEMGSSWAQVIEKLKRDKVLLKQFRAVYKDGLTSDNIADAIASFERTLVTVNSPFDRWLKGDDNALSDEALKGYQLFKSYGCIACHQGANVGGNMFAKIGTFENYFAQNGGAKIRDVDRGRFNVTKQKHDLYMFKVPSLRLAAKNSFFFHDSRTQSLHSAISIMGRVQLGREIPSQDIELMVAFLHSLVGEYHRLDE